METQATYRMNRPVGVYITLAPGTPTCASGAVELIGLNLRPRFNLYGVGGISVVHSSPSVLPLILEIFPTDGDPELKGEDKTYSRHLLLHNKPASNIEA